MNEWDGTYPEDHEQEVAYVVYMVSGWLRNMTGDAVAANKIIAPEAVSEALRYLSELYDTLDSTVDFDEQLKQLLEEEL